MQRLLIMSQQRTKLISHLVQDCLERDYLETQIDKKVEELKSLGITPEEISENDLEDLFE